MVDELGSPPCDFTDFLGPKANISFQFSTVTTDTVSKAIDSINIKPTQDCYGMSTEMLKLVKDDIVDTLTAVVNQIIVTGKFPSKLKIARVTAIFKKGDKHLYGNYRPISILPALSKVIERILHDQLIAYFTKNDLLYGSQYGFRKGHSTELAAAELIDRIMNNLDSRDSYISIFADLSKAFDCINHDILLSKLAHYGLEKKSVALMNSYLSDRYQFVKFDNITSESTSIDIGVPQGSILGPLLFTIYINDITEASHILQPILYADDSTFSVSLEIHVNILNLPLVKLTLSTL